MSRNVKKTFLFTKIILTFVYDLTQSCLYSNIERISHSSPRPLRAECQRTVQHAHPDLHIRQAIRR